VLTASGQLDHLYFKFDDQVFQCDGLDCGSAAQSLDDYCCERGEFAPSKDGGGCTLPAGASTALRGESGTTNPGLLGVGGALLAGALILRRRAALK
jgi:LPXTG-motif cell wall-anchored protein